jgi:hypothetical protein
MRRARWLVGCLAATGCVTAAPGVASGATYSTAAAEDCPVTLPNGSTPPGENSGPTWTGNAGLWTFLPIDGHLLANRRGSLPLLKPDGSVDHKILWLGRRDRTTPDLKRLRFVVTAKRLDQPAARFKKTGRGAGWNGKALYWPMILRFPSAGCFKVVGQLSNGARLSAVMSVEAKP